MSFSANCIRRGGPAEENPPEVGGVEVGDRQAEVHVVRHVEDSARNCSARLAARAGSRARATRRRGVARAARDVAAGVAELAGLRSGVQALKRRAADPLVDGVRAGVRIADEVGAAGGEARDRRAVGLQRDVGGVGHRERRARVVRGDPVQLPAAEDGAHGGRRAVRQTRGSQLALATNRWRASNSDGPYSASEVERVLRQVVLAGERLGRRAREVHRRQFVYRAREPVRDVEPHAAR